MMLRAYLRSTRFQSLRRGAGQSEGSRAGLSGTREVPCLRSMHFFPQLNRQHLFLFGHCLCLVHSFLSSTSHFTLTLGHVPMAGGRSREGLKEILFFLPSPTTPLKISESLFAPTCHQEEAPLSSSGFSQHWPHLQL